MSFPVSLYQVVVQKRVSDLRKLHPLIFFRNNDGSTCTLRATCTIRKGNIHKPRGLLRGKGPEGSKPNDHLTHKSYSIKVITKGVGVQKIPKIVTTWFMDDPLKAKRSPTIMDSSTN